MNLESASATLTRALKEAGFSFESPSLDRAIEALSAFIREPMEDIAQGTDADRAFCEFGAGTANDPSDWYFGIYRQVFVAEDSQNMMRYGLEIVLNDSPQLAALVSEPGAAEASYVELWRESSEVDEWLAEIRAAPAFPALLNAPIARAHFIADPL